MNQTEQQTDQAQVNAELIAAERIALMHESAGLEAPDSFPMNTAQVLRLFQSLDFHVDGDFIIGLCETGILQVKSYKGHRQWNPLACFELSMVLDSRRRWKPTNRHLHKMTALERQSALMEQQGDEFITDLDQYDVEQLVLMLEQMENQDVRHVLRIALISKLRQAGAL